MLPEPRNTGGLSISLRRDTMLLKGNLNGFRHLGMPVTDVVATGKWYTSKLGFRLISQHAIPTEEGDIKVAFLDLDGLVLECYQLVGAANDEIKTRGDGPIDYFAVAVVDAERALALALEAGDFKDPSTPGDLHAWALSSKGMKSVVLRGPTRERIELTQKPDVDSEPAGRAPCGLSHVGIATTDIRASIAFYSQLGFREVADRGHGARRGRFASALLEQEGFRIRVAHRSGRASDAKSERSDGHIDHVALNLRDVDSAYAELNAAGFRPLEDSPVTLSMGQMSSRIFNIRGPSGEKIEMAQALA
jgi:catechol 2,3-dioxygenase-like lactoylglutathione lyase family enzyme